MYICVEQSQTNIVQQSTVCGTNVQSLPYTGIVVTWFEENVETIRSYTYFKVGRHVPTDYNKTTVIEM